MAAAGAAVPAGSIRVYLGSLPGDSAAPPPGRCTIRASGATAASACGLVADSAGLPAELGSCFGLHFVSAEGSVHRFDPDDALAAVIPTLPEGEFLYTKVTIRPVDEAALLRNEAALTLLFADCESRVETGVINPTSEQLERLDDFANPEFRAKRQYVELAQQVPDYDSVRLRHSVLLPSPPVDQNPISLVGLAAGPVDVSVSPRGVLIAPCQGEVGDGAGAAGLEREVLLEFRRIRKWTTVEHTTPLKAQNFGVEYLAAFKPNRFVWVAVRTDEALLAQQTMAALAPRLHKDANPEWPALKAAPRPRGGGNEDNVAWFSPAAAV